MKNKIIFLGMIFVFGVLILRSPTDEVSAQGTGGQCSGSVHFVEPFDNETLTDVRFVRLNTDDNITRVTFFIDGDILGRAKLDANTAAGGNAPQWVMQWSTQYTQAGSHSLTARVTYNNQTSCTTNIPVNVTVANPNIAPLDVSMHPQITEMLTHSAIDFMVNHEDTTSSGFVNLSEFAVVNWSVSGRGSIVNRPQNVVSYSSGPDEGSGTVKATVHYAGQVVSTEHTVFVDSPYVETDSTQQGGTNDTSDFTNNDENETLDENTESTENVDSNSGSTDSTRRTFEVEQTFQPAEVVNRILESENPVDMCILDKLGQDNLRRLADENRTPSSSEFDKYLKCFEEQRYIVPSVLAPVQPKDVVSTRVSSRVEIFDIVNEDKVAEDGITKSKVLVFSGVTTPNTNVLLYIFSEPLVLATTSDSEGNWSYSLEDPLTSGEHEVYALVDKGDGEYERSDFASIFIGTAEASEENPNGFSLELIAEPTISASNRTVNLFIASTIGMVTFVSVLLFSFWFQARRYPESFGQDSPKQSTITDPTSTNFHDTL